MEKQQETMEREPCDSMTTVIMKDLGMDYPDPPPSYKTAGRSATTAVQITKIIAMSGIIIAAMISFSLIFSAWLTSSNGLCQNGNQPVAEALLAPQQLLQTALLKSINDLESAERKMDAKDKKAESEDDSGEGQGQGSDDDPDDDVVTIFNIPFKDVFDNAQNQRIPLTCAFEKTAGDGSGADKERTLPPLFSLNISTDTRCLRFTGENISICCDLAISDESSAGKSLKNEERSGRNLSLRKSNTNSGVVGTSASEQEPLHVIGPIPLASRSAPSILPEILNEIWGGSNHGLESMIPLLQAPQEPNFKIQVQELGLGGPIFIPQNQDGVGPLSHFLNIHRSTPRIKMSHHHGFPEGDTEEQGIPLLLQASDIRQRALHQPIPLVPRHHFPHVIRPRSTEEGI